MTVKYIPMRVEGKEAHPLVEQSKNHDHALATALSIARYPLDVPLENVRYVVYKNGKPCDCETCRTLDKESLFDPNVCSHCRFKQFA